ncbi:MAG: peptidoglycan-binding protein [Clostridia bacterium]|nr:peptidoglycan-binding protein [Clostridia bacterium]
MRRFIAVFITASMLLCFALPVFAQPPQAIGYGATGDDVVRIQLRLRELGYFMYKPTGNYQSMTVNAAIAFQSSQVDENGYSIAADGVIGPQSLGILFGLSARRADIKVDIPFGKTEASVKVSGQMVSWDSVKERLTVGNTYTVIDCYSGTEFSIVFYGGEFHAEIECSTPEDADIYKNLFGGEYNYSKRPVCLKLGDELIAASLQGHPHGEDHGADDGEMGHSCLYFEGSRSHIGSLRDVEHNTQVYKAAGR